MVVTVSRTPCVSLMGQATKIRPKSDCPQFDVRRIKGNVEIDSVSSNASVAAISGVGKDILKGSQFCGMPSADVKKLLIYAQSAVVRDSDGDSPLHLAVVHGNVSLVRHFCTLYKYIGMPVDVYNYLLQTPLHLAVLTGNFHIIKLLLEEGASVDLVDRNGNTAVHLALKNFKEDCLELLLHHSFYSDALGILNNDGYAPLHLAVLSSNKKAVELLANARCYINAQDGKGGRTALLYTVLTNQEKIMQPLLDNGACANIADYSGNSPTSILNITRDHYLMDLIERSTLVMKPYSSSEKSNS